MSVQELTKAAGKLHDVARALGVSSRCVTNWRAGRTRGIAFRHVLALCKLAGVAVEDVTP